jgi:hypothetical protein
MGERWSESCAGSLAMRGDEQIGVAARQGELRPPVGQMAGGLWMYRDPRMVSAKSGGLEALEDRLSDELLERSYDPAAPQLSRGSKAAVWPDPVTAFRTLSRSGITVSLRWLSIPHIPRFARPDW